MKIKRKYIFAILGMIGMCFLFFFVTPVSVNATENVYGSYNDIDYFKPQTTRADNVVAGVGSSIYQILFRVGLYGTIFALMICGISFLIKGGDSKERSELKSWLLRIGIVLVAITSLTSIMGLLGRIFEKAF